MKKALLVLSLLALFSHTMAQKQAFKISLNTGPNHSRNITLKEFFGRLQQKLGEENFEVQIFESGALFDDSAVPRALAQGTLDMGFPPIDFIGTLVPNAGVVNLPMFYGRTLDEVHRVLDGPMGKELYKEIEAKLGVKVLGRGLDLGYISIFTTKKPLKQTADFAGLKMRIVGGAPVSLRYQNLKALPVALPFADVPLALTQGTIDGLMTTHETVRSSKLWEAGLKYAFDDRQSFVMYLPMISGRTWEKLSEKQQQILQSAWEETVDAARKLAAERQASASKEAQANGITLFQPTRQDVSQTRSRLLALQDQIIKDSRINPIFAAKVFLAFSK